jgi:hypothetical protein
MPSLFIFLCKVERFIPRPFGAFPRGGHFAVMESPDFLVSDIREFFRRFR